MDVIFVDTSVLVYAYDGDAGWKHDVARAELVRLWDAKSGVLSAQVLQEFYVTVTRKLPKPLPIRTARAVVETYLAWPLYRPEGQDLLTASKLQERHRVSFWDALVIVAAQRLGATVILSEDLQQGQRFQQTSITNPFVEPSAERSR